MISNCYKTPKCRLIMFHSEVAGCKHVKWVIFAHSVVLILNDIFRKTTYWNCSLWEKLKRSDFSWNSILQEVRRTPKVAMSEARILCSWGSSCRNEARKQIDIEMKKKELNESFIDVNIHRESTKVSKQLKLANFSRPQELYYKILITIRKVNFSPTWQYQNVK